MIIRYQSNIGGLLPTPGIHGGVNERKRDPADFWTRERSHLDGGDMGDTPPFRLAKETNHSPRKRLFSLSSGGGVDPPLSGRRPASATPFLAAGHPGHPPLSTGTVPLPSLRTRPKDWSTQKPPVCLNPPQTPGNSQRRDFGGQRLTQRLVCPFFSALVRREGAGHPPRRVKLDLELHHQD